MIGAFQPSGFQADAFQEEAVSPVVVVTAPGPLDPLSTNDLPAWPAMQIVWPPREVAGSGVMRLAAVMTATGEADHYEDDDEEALLLLAA